MVERRTLFSSQKNEGPFLMEWLAWHHVVGFNRFVLFSNDCSDGSDRLLDVLADKGIIEHYVNAPVDGLGPQSAAAHHAMAQQLFTNGEWVAWYDCDEFLLPTAGAQTLDDLLAAGDFDALATPWRLMGDSGNRTFPGRHISRYFNRGAHHKPSDRTPTKALFRMSPDIIGFGIHRPIFKDPDVRHRHRYIFSDGSPVLKNYYLGGDGNNPCSIREGVMTPYARAQVLHFSVRTPDMFALKAMRGDGFFLGDKIPARDAERYARDNRNDVAFTGHLVHEQAVTDQIAAWMADPDIAQAAIAAGTAPLATQPAPPRPLQNTPAPKGQSMIHRYPKSPSNVPTDALVAALTPADPVQICDVGANPLDAEAAYQDFLAHGIGHVVGFEPQPDALARLNASKSDAETYLPQAVGTGGASKLHIFKSSGFASMFPADQSTVEIFERFDVMTRLRETIPMETVPLDDIADVPAIDILKIDVQGSEFDILCSGREKMKTAVAIQTEVRFFPIYEGEPDYGDLHLELVSQGFRLHTFLNNKNQRLKHAHTATLHPNNSTQLLDGDAIYLRDLRGTADWSNRQLQITALFGLLMYPAPDMVLFVCDQLVKRGALDADLAAAYAATRPQKKKK